ncbi:hypothetical protein Q8F55_007318 [Vanrija albida]|uniref:CFEM domain-containing protein n=1 Tax=Vanrija albida TaxID=181172 RepID=A0ABR3PZZ6_9TREE
MKAFTIFAVLSTLSVSVLAQAPPWTGPVDPLKVDPCLANCSLQAGQAVGCDPTDQKCICTDKKTEFQQAAIPCIISNQCDPIIAQKTSDQVCQYGFITTGGTTSPPAESSTTAAESTTAGPGSSSGVEPTTGAPPTTSGGTAPTCKPKARRRAHVRAQL